MSDEAYDVLPEKRKSKKDMKRKRLYRVYKRGGRFRAITTKKEKKH